jgi:hypothetical protein
LIHQFPQDPIKQRQLLSLPLQIVLANYLLLPVGLSTPKNSGEYKQLAGRRKSTPLASQLSAPPFLKNRKFPVETAQVAARGE